jgi:hypothetical protein
MSTQLNLGASYLVNDFYQRFIRPDASQKHLVWAGRLFTVISTVLGLGLGLLLTSAGQAFQLLLLLGAGTGLIYILRWFWWRINAWTEIVAMISSMIIASYFTFMHDQLGFLPLADWEKLVGGAVLTTLVWVLATFFTPVTSDEKLREFYRKIRPGGNGWDPVLAKAAAEGVPINKEQGQLPLEILSMMIGCITIYAALFTTGNWIYGNTATALLLTAITGAGTAFLFWVRNRLKAD